MPIISPSFHAERRRRLTRRYPISQVFGKGQLSAGASRTVSIPFLILRTVNLGANRIAEDFEDPASTPTNANDPWASYDNAFGFWGRPQYLHVVMAKLILDLPQNATATTYTGVEIASLNQAPPFPVPPNPSAPQQTLQVRARMDTGTWELWQSDGSGGPQAIGRTDDLTGVDLFTEVSRGYRVELFYDPAGKITVSVNGKVGLVVSGASFIINPNEVPPDQGLGCFVTSGSHASGRNSASFHNLIHEIIGMP